MFPGQADDRLENIATMINNHSIMIKSKENKPVEALLREMRVQPDVDEGIVSSAMNVEKIDRRTERQIKSKRMAEDREAKFRAKIDPPKQAELENAWKDFVAERKRRRERKRE